MLCTILAQEVAVKGIVIIAKERLLATVTALRDVMGDAGNKDARETGRF